MQSTYNKFYYGVDLLGELHGTAGTGGVRIVNINAKEAFAFNNLVGNVEALFDASDGTTLLAEYEYSPFGEIRKQDGALASANPLRFSSRYSENETGLYYYSFREYSSRLKKWLSKEPKGEKGGLNLYEFAKNNTSNYFDSEGFASAKPNNLTSDQLKGLKQKKRVCAKYIPPKKSGLGSCCKDEQMVDDTYIPRAKKICEWFFDYYYGLDKVRKVAKCLVDAERRNQKVNLDCQTRNASRVWSHISCYAKNRFFPIMDVPSDDWKDARDVGWQILLPDFISDAVETMGESLTNINVL